MLMAVSAYSQQPDTTCPETAKLRKLYGQAKEAKVVQERLDTCESGLQILNGQIYSLERQVSEYQDKSARQEIIIRLYEQKITASDRHNAQLTKDVQVLQTKIKRQKKKNFIITVLSIAGSVAGTIIILK